MSIVINELTPKQHQALVCMYFAMMPSSDIRYRKRTEYWTVLQNKFNKRVSTYKNAKDAYDYYFDNNRRGWSNDRTLAQRGKEYQEVFDLYKDYSIDEVEVAVEEIIKLYKSEVSSFISLKCNLPDTVHSIMNGESVIVIDGVYTLRDSLKLGKIVFITLGGDVGRAEVDWEPGFFAVGRIIKEPYDFNYNGTRYYKFDLEVLCRFSRAYKREEFLGYQDAFDATYIGPELRRDPTQAISNLDDNKAVAVIRGVLDNESNLKSEFEKIFPREFMERVLGAVRVLIPTTAVYGETTEDIISNFQDEQQILSEADNNSDSYSKDDSEDSIEIKPLTGGENILFYGVPGAGKSHTIDKIIDGEKFKRVIFHPDYTYSDFVGQIMPIIKKDDDGNEKLSYKFVQGPFTKILCDAVKNPDKMHYLVIEEINRGNAPAIFGDIFQLLDRKENGEGKYCITNFDIGREVSEDKDEDAEVRIPSNLTILATMNTSDQNVFTLDTAFQRRWNMKYIPNDIDAAEHANETIEGSEVTWGRFANTVNKEITEYNTGLASFEDKQLGAYFVNKGELSSEKFPEKVLKYLWDDVFKMDRTKIFSKYIKSIGELINKYSGAGDDNDALECVLDPDVYKKMREVSINEMEDTAN